MDSKLRRSLSRALAFKLFALIALWALFFSPSHRLRPTPQDMISHLSSTTPL